MFEKYFAGKPRILKDIFEIAFAFLTAFGFYQLLIFVTGTPMPIVSVVSNSMYHSADFDQWWASNSKFYEQAGISKEEFSTYTAKNGFYMGDIVFSVGGEPEVGDIVIYNSPRSYTIIHRVIEVRDEGYVVKGDNNGVPDPLVVRKDQIVGKALFSAPLLGWPRLLLYAIGI